MAYLDNRRTKNRTAAIIAVTALEAAVIYAVISGLAVTFIEHKDDTLTGIQIPLTPPPPPRPTESATPRETKINTPDDTRIETIPNQFGTETVGPRPMDTPTPIDMGPVVIETPPPTIPDPTPSYTPRSAQPRGKPGEWVTTNDYPTRDLREGHQGVTQFSVSVGTDGRVQSCTIVSSSGHPGLDAATCAKVTARAGFNPATDSSGTTVTGTYTNSIRWVIPE
jgi:periplasmic protein TonB